MVRASLLFEDTPAPLLSVYFIPRPLHCHATLTSCSGQGPDSAKPKEGPAMKPFRVRIAVPGGALNPLSELPQSPI